MIVDFGNGWFETRFITFDKPTRIELNGVMVVEVFPRDCVIRQNLHPNGDVLPVGIDVEHSPPLTLCAEGASGEVDGSDVQIRREEDGYYVKFRPVESAISAHFVALIKTGALRHTSIGAGRSSVLEKTVVSASITRFTWREICLTSISLVRVPFHVN